ncbi:MAG: large conductance mechanosensitive channel protein MscL [bacterium]
MINEFKTFLMRGNVLDMAVGVIIGAAFGKIVSSFTNDVLMPPLGMLLGKVDFSSLYLNLSGTPYDSLKAAEDAGAAVIKYGVFLNTTLDFIIMAFVVFLIVKQVNQLMPAPPPPAATTFPCPKCCMDIPIAATRCGHCTSELATPAQA